MASLKFSFSMSLDISTIAAVASLLPFFMGITSPLDCDKTVRTVVTSRIHELAQITSSGRDGGVQSGADKQRSVL